jgi:hypothetical protein
VKQARDGDGDGDVEASDRLINFELCHVRSRNSTVRQEGMERSGFSFHFGSPNSPHDLQGKSRRIIGQERCFLI